MKQNHWHLCALTVILITNNLFFALYSWSNKSIKIYFFDFISSCLILCSDRWTHSQAIIHPSTCRHFPGALLEWSLHCLPLPLRCRWVVISMCTTSTRTQGWSLRCPWENWFKGTRPRPDPIHSSNQCFYHRCRSKEINHLRCLTTYWSAKNQRSLESGRCNYVWRRMDSRYCK